MHEYYINVYVCVDRDIIFIKYIYIYVTDETLELSVYNSSLLHMKKTKPCNNHKSQVLPTNI